MPRTTENKTALDIPDIDSAPSTSNPTVSTRAPVWPAGPGVLDLAACPLDGVNLIEASAGTGKTHTITRLYLRMLLEQNLRVEEILVVTFTIAATEELRERIRSLLQKTIQVLNDPVNVAPGDELLESLARSDRRDSYLRRCRDALGAFDRAAIYTIHGFCHRMLREHAFESGVSFGMRLAGDQSAYVEEMIQDHWRRRLYDAPAAFLEYALGSGLRPESLMAFYRQTAAHPRLELIEPGDPAAESESESDAPIADPGEEFERIKEKLRLAWPGVRDELREFLTGGWLNRRSYTPARVDAALAEMERFLGGHPDAFSKSDFFDLLRASTVAARRTRIPGPATPAILHQFDRLAEMAAALTDAMNFQILRLEGELVGAGGPRRALAAKKRADEVLSYDDLLLGLERALNDPEDGPTLRESIRSSFRAALIDEFQDTDQVQWNILEGLFRTERHTLFLIGDPKQSIYSFRGADVFAYIAAKRGADRCYGLQENYRALPRLTAAVNTLFAREGLHAGGDFHGPFLYREIPYYPVEAAARKDPLLIRGRDGSGLLVELLRDDSGERAYLPRESARQQATALTVREIERLLELGRQGHARLGEDPVQPGDIAVLVRTNREADLVQRSLRAAGLHAIIRSEKSLFHSREAEEIARLLNAVEQPHSESALRAALITELIGTDAEALEALFAGPEERERRLRDFAGYRALRNTRGFMVMFRRLLKKENILERLLRLPDGERRVANLLHLGELLYRESLAGPGRETAWLLRMREKPDNQDEYLPRLESDERAVQIVTVHFSKGLEYPIVFCPFLWNSRVSNKNEALIVHDRKAGRYSMLPALARERGAQAGFDPERISAYEEEAGRERLAEDARLAYVALTRASHRCYLYWGKINRTADSALSFLLHGGDETLDEFRQRAKKLSSAAIFADLRDIAAASGGSIIFAEDERGAVQTSNLSGETGEANQTGTTDEIANANAIDREGARPRPEDLKRRLFTGEIRPGPVLSSFSSLTAGGHQAPIPAGDKPEHADSLATPLSEGETKEPGGENAATDDEFNIFAFPRGAHAGDFFHELFETVDFADPAGIPRIVAETLPRYGFAAEWEAAAARQIQDVLTCPMPAGDREIVLASVDAHDRAPEMDFTFPLPRPGNAPPSPAPELVSNLPFQALRETWPAKIPSGYMKGFIDLVFRDSGRFYVLDWKSSHLGDDIDCYQESRLLPVMTRSGYILQYYIYTLAVHRYLATRLPDYDYERDFGGVFYVFLRGVRPARSGRYGIFFDRPPLKALQSFEKALAKAEESR